jgi:membrane-associated protease RseP (regulator of RpoE activity)
MNDRTDLKDRFGRALAGGTGLREPQDRPPPTPEEARRNLGNLAVGVALLIALSVVLHALTTLLLIVALLSFVMLHEAGHFVTAKRSGMKVSEYFVGFGPRLWSVRRGETEYGVRALPLGGYVRIVGMNNLDPIDPADEPRSYRAQSFPKRLVVALAGSTVHFLIALILLFVLNQFAGVTDFNRPVPRVDGLQDLTTGLSPAQQAGFRKGDVILATDGIPVRTFDDVTKYVQARPGVAIQFLVRRGSQQLTLVGTPVDLQTVKIKPSPDVASRPPPTKPTGFMGILVGTYQKDYAANPAVAVGRSFVQFGRDVGLSGQALASIFSPHGISSISHQVFSNANSRSGSSSPNDVRPVSVVGIVHVSNQAAKAGAEPLLTVLMAINIFVGVFNLIPLPPFDGGLVAVAVYERIRSRRGQRYRADVSRLLPLAYGTFLVLMVLAFSGLYLDLVHPL